MTVLVGNMNFLFCHELDTVIIRDKLEICCCLCPNTKNVAMQDNKKFPNLNLLSKKGDCCKMVIIYLNY